MARPKVGFALPRDERTLLPMKSALIALARSTGFREEAIKKWRQRGHVPAKHREFLLRSARRRLLEISESDFVFAPTKGTGTSGMVHIGTLAKNIVRRLVYLR